ncbi:MAG: hypothetical protein PVF58_02740 [Candidatus Methanofastidiosia archaeon]|jgi:hypothetical protein
MWTFTDLEGEYTLILGEVHTGKTQLTQKLLKEAETLKKEIAVIDMAPQFENERKVGGKLCPGKNTVYYTTTIETPRLSGETLNEVFALAELNKEKIEKIFDIYVPKEVLFMNDVSIYLQRGNFKTLVNIISSAQTCIMNGYYGTSLGKDRLSQEERSQMVKLQKYCHNIIRR